VIAVLGSVLRDLFRPAKDSTPPARRVLNVGGGSKSIPIPPHYAGWEHVLLDIDARAGPDIVCDARKLESLQPHQFDAVYCSHNLEHYHRHDGVAVLRGFLHVLKSDGFAEIRVPDLQAVMRHAVEAGLELESLLYESPAGPIAVHDVIFGFGKEIESSGSDFYAHKTGFSSKSLCTALERAGFAKVWVPAVPLAFEIHAFAFKSEPTQIQLASLAGPAARP
jgi:hypothetical protein